MVRLRVGFVSWLGFALSAMAEPGYKSLPELPSELRVEAQLPAGSAVVASPSFDFGEPLFVPNGKGQARVSLPGAKTLRVETLPDLPYIERVYDLGGEATAGVSWGNPVAWISPGSADLATSEETLFWTAGPRFTFAKPGDGRYYPGKIADVHIQGSQAVVRVFPLQWDRTTGELIRLAHLDLTLFAKKSENKTTAHSTSASVILVREAQRDLAEMLQDFHLKRYGMVSEVVTVESIAKSETEISESELPDGYKSRALAEDSVVEFDASTGKGYDYGLARKLDAYFQKRLGVGSALKYITLLGDGAAIPPSYYFSVRNGFGANFGPTDQCYASVKKCLDSRAAVGRLPLASLAEMRTYLSKVDRWIRTSPSLPSELALYGGKPFQNPFYTGELGSLRALGTSPDWTGVRKYFRTKKNYDRKTVLRMVRGGENSAVVFSLDHGGGNKWYVERNSVSSQEILSAPDGGQGINPLVFSISCTNAAYDETTTKEELFEDTSFGDQSVGVSMLRSPAGAVAYFGSARPVLGSPVFEIDTKGNLNLEDSNHSLKILETALESYRTKSGNRLGDHIRESLMKYGADPASSLTQDRSRWTYFNATFLGDPVMVLPKRNPTEKAFALAEALDVLQAVVTGYFPALAVTAPASARIRFSSPAPVEATLFRIETRGSRTLETVIDFEKSAGGTSDAGFRDESIGQRYFMRIENQTGVPVERQVWFSTDVLAK